VQVQTPKKEPVRKIRNLPMRVQSPRKKRVREQKLLQRLKERVRELPQRLLLQQQVRVFL